MVTVRGILRAILLPLTVVAGTAVSFAQIGTNSKLAEDYIASGEDAFKKGQFTLAAQNYSRALRAEDIEDKQVAALLYRRGEAHERAGQPAQAIADITSALYLPSLSASDRAKAYLARGRAYEAVGLASQARSDIAKARSGGVDESDIARSSQPAQTASSGGSVPTFRTLSEDSGGGRRSRQSAPSFATSSEAAAPPPPSFETSSSATAPPPKKRQQVAAFDTTSRAASGGRDEDIPRFRTTILPQESSAGSSAQTPAAGDAQDDSGGRVSGFIGNLWSKATGKDDEKDSGGKPPPAASPQWSQSTRAAAPPPPSFQTSSNSAAAPAAAPAAPANAARPATVTGGSGYRIQLAALKSDAEAQATWKRLRSRHGNLLQNYQPNIVKTELGGLGTFYRLQLGPFADKEQSKQLCNNFKAGGLDCFLLAP